MSYIYSRALVAEYSVANCSDIDASALLNESHMHKPSWWHDKTMEPSRHSRFGMTYAPLTESLGADLLTWFVADSLAKTSVLPETVPDWTAKGQGYGQKWLGLLGRYDPDTHSLKTAQLSLLEDSTECCPTLPRWGLMLDGELFPQPMLVPFTVENESGFSLPTPCATDAGSGRFNTSVGSDNKRPTLAMMAKRNLWPTPITQDNVQIRGKGAAANAPTRGTTLAGAVKMFPTATTATASKGWSKNHNRANSDDRLDYTIEREAHQSGVTGRLNPEFCEWLMGWPIGQTALNPLETAKFQEWQQQHSPFFRKEADAA